MVLIDTKIETAIYNHLEGSAILRQGVIVLGLPAYDGRGGFRRAETGVSVAVAVFPPDIEFIAGRQADVMFNVNASCAPCQFLLRSA